MKKTERINRSHVKYIIKWASLIIVLIVFLSLLGYSFIIYGGKLIVDEEALVLKATTTIETKDGKVVAEIYHENRQLIDIEQIPDHVLQAFVAIEDRRFYRHAGIDLKSIIRAVYRDIVAFSKVEGASTITQQLAKNLFLSKDKTWMRKTKEAMAAIYLERNFSKDEILELYLNAIYFGHGVYGIETAAQKFFSKSVSDLTIAEGALLAGIINSPNKYSPIDHPKKALARRELVLQNMAKAGYITVEQSLTESGKTLGLNIKNDISSPWNDSYVDLVLKEAVKDYQISFAELQRGGYRIVTHLDELIQKRAYELFLEDNYFPGSKEGVEGAFVMLEHQTGQIVTALGGRNYQLGDLNRTTTKRQPGSTIKPLAIYGPALMQETYHPYSLIKDEPLEYDGYVAKNYDNLYDGETTIYEALIYSKNAPAVWLLNEIGVQEAKKYFQKMNIPLEDDGLAIALGGLTEGLSPLELASSYQMIANGGFMLQPMTIDQIYNQQKEPLERQKPFEQQIFSTQVSWELTKMLEATVQRGTAHPGTYNHALAGKTGSTQHLYAQGFYKDAWFVGFTPKYVTSLWMGYDYSDEAHYLTEGSNAATILTKDILMNIEQQIVLGESFEKPESVIDLPDPVELPTITDVHIEYKYGLWPFVQGLITWSGSTDERIIYQIYEEKKSGAVKIGEVIGDTSFMIEDVSLFKEQSYFIVPVDPLTNRVGERSEIITLSW